MALAQRARSLGMSSLALTDKNGLYGMVRFHQACRATGLHPVIGSEVIVEGHPLVLLCASHQGYANLCRLLTQAHLRDRDQPIILLHELGKRSDGLICLTGGREGRLWNLVAAHRSQEARAWLQSLHGIFPHRLYVELCNGLLPEDGSMVERLYLQAWESDVSVVATNDARFATPEDHRRYDLLTCIRLGITVSDPHPDRPRNSEAHLKPEHQLRRLIPFPEAFDNSMAIARSCHLDLVPEYITPPSASLPKQETAQSYLRQLCTESLPRTYSPDRLPRAEAQLDKEMVVISRLGLEEFFLVVREVVSEAQRRGILCAGRGSAANSIIAYLLGITSVDPLEHNLLFERFLHGGRKGTPDIDVDFDSDRREEIISWMEDRFGIEQTAMTATLVTYRLRLALRDVAKTLGWAQPIVERVTETVPFGEVGEVGKYRGQISGVLGECSRLDLLLDLVASLDHCPRHLGLHVGGMVLSRKPICHFSPVQVSPNGVKMVQFDKLDIEAMGLVKLDVLALRMLAALSEGKELVERHEGIEVDLSSLPLDDEETFELIRSGQTLALFQIESMGQMHLIARTQPRTFDDLITEIALFRPGPLQGNMVHPFVRRKNGQEPVRYDHPDLEPILRDTFGVILFQEQVLEIAHQFAGMSLEEADDFRALMTRFRDPSKMETMRERFVSGAVSRGVDETTAQHVFDQVAKFVGYGFCRSHAAAFARTVYHSAWMKCHHPAAYMAAFLQHRPGMYNQMTLEQEARRCGVDVMLPSVNKSGSRYDLARLEDGQLGIRKPLTAVDGISEETAKRIAWGRMSGPFLSVEDLARRVDLPQDSLDAMARSGALDELAGSSRQALWEIGVLVRRRSLEPSRDKTLFDMPLIEAADIPELPDLSPAERLSWDYKTQSASRAHPIILARRTLSDMGIPPVESCYRIIPAFEKGRGNVVAVAGVVIIRQRPPTARGFMFLTIEDETGYLQCVVHPKVQERIYDTLTEPALIVQGELQATGNWRAMVLSEAWPLEGIFGGHTGHPSSRGNQGRLTSQTQGSDQYPPEPEQPIPLRQTGS